MYALLLMWCCNFVTLYFNSNAYVFYQLYMLLVFKQRPEDGRVDRNRLPKINKYKAVLDGAVYTFYCLCSLPIVLSTSIFQSFESAGL